MGHGNEPEYMHEEPPWASGPWAIIYVDEDSKIVKINTYNATYGYVLPREHDNPEVDLTIRLDEEGGLFYARRMKKDVGFEIRKINKEDICK